MMEPGVKVVVIPCPTVDYGQQTVSFPRYDLERMNRMWLEWAGYLPLTAETIRYGWRER
jgi:hypothetical protein